MNAQRQINLEFEGQKAIVDVKLESFDQLKSFIIAKFTGLPERIKIFYLDSDNDEITVSCNEDFEYFLLEEKSISLLSVKIYSDSDATEEDGDDEDFSSSSCCDSESGEERSHQIKKEEEEEENKKENSNEIQVSKELKDKQVGSSEIVVGEELENPSKKEEENKEVQCGVSTCDQSEQIGSSRQPGDLQDASGQTVSIACQDDGTQAIAEQKDDSTQAKAELKDNEMQAQADSQDSQTQAQVQSSDFQTQARVDQSDLCTQVQVDQVENGMQTNMKELKENGQQAREEGLGQNQLQNNQNNSLERKLLELEERLKEELQKRDTLIEQMRQDINKLQGNEKQTGKNLLESKENPNNYFNQTSQIKQNNIQEGTGNERISQLKVVLSQAAASFNALPSSTSKCEAEKQFAQVISTLQLALGYSDASFKLISKCEPTFSKDNKLNQNSEIEESKDDALEQQNSDLRIVINRKSTSAEEQEEEERLRAYQLKLKNQHTSSEIEKVLKEKEYLAQVFNQEVADNAHKDYPPEVVKKATEIATLTGEQPSLYFKYVSDYSQNSVNDLIDMLFNHNIAYRYFPK